MKRAIINYSLVALLTAAAIIEAVSGFVLWFALPHVGGGSRGLGALREFWSLGRTTWVDLHNYAAIALLVIVIVHIIFHWKWIVCVTKQIMRMSKKNVESVPVPAECRIEE